MIAVNDNLTIAEFKAYAAPKPSIAMVIENDPEIARYYLMGGEGWALVRFGAYQFDRPVPRRFMAFPVAAAPHPLCPAHNYAPPAAHRPPLRSKLRPSHLQVVA
ncbi:hypothetical protein [Methylobacterium oryzae]|uniref:hypothetical protein n=1 Tax=Methylobacterium oryzae TaxID=334852 RepID=UPI001F4074B1|nr:hypothetical protein [Methylobacterium oryzae]UIN38364.1 hypothetical protein LXM90_30750 [Methylobacterium oryzae]